MNEHSDSWNTETNTKLKEDKSDSYEIQIFRNICDILSHLFEPQFLYKIRLNNPFAIIWGLNETSAAAAAKSLQSCLTLCDLIDGSPPGSPVPGILQGKNTGVGCHFLLQCMKVKSESEVTQSCPTPSDPMDCSLPGSSVHGIFQARVLEWGAIAFSKECVKDAQCQAPPEKHWIRNSI